MASIRRTSMIDSNKTQLNSDYDYSMLRKWALGNKGGLLKKSDFVFDKSKGELSAGSEIAEAVILCKRTTSYPIQNQTFLAQFQFTGKLENLQTVEGTKIYIEIKENLIVDPTLIADQPGSTNFAKGFDIGEIKATPERPSHENYLKLYEISNGEVVDHRKEISLPALDSVSQRTTTLEEKVSQAEQKVGKLEEAGAPDHLEIIGVVGEKISVVQSEQWVDMEGSSVVVKRLKFSWWEGRKDFVLIKIFDPFGNLIWRDKYINPHVLVNQEKSSWWENLPWWTIFEFKKPEEIRKILFKYYLSYWTPINPFTSIPKIEADSGDWVRREILWWRCEVSPDIGGNPGWHTFTFSHKPKQTNNNKVNVFLEQLPAYSGAKKIAKIGNEQGNKEIHIQRISSGKPSTQIDLKLQCVWQPTTNLEVEVRRWVAFESQWEKYWYGWWELLASCIIPYSNITPFWKKITAILNKNIALNRGELYSIILKQSWWLVNSINHYELACDEKMWSNASTYIKVSWENRNSGYMIPYCDSIAFEQNIIAKTSWDKNDLIKKWSYTYELPSSVDVWNIIKLISFGMKWNEWISCKKVQEINKSISWTANSSFIVPNDWLLIVNCSVTWNSSNGWDCLVNGSSVFKFWKSYSNQSLSLQTAVFVKRWSVSIQTQNNDWYASMTVKEFIPL